MSEKISLDSSAKNTKILPDCQKLLFLPIRMELLSAE